MAGIIMAGKTTIGTMVGIKLQALALVSELESASAGKHKPMFRNSALVSTTQSLAGIATKIGFFMRMNLLNNKIAEQQKIERMQSQEKRIVLLSLGIFIMLLIVKSLV
jgi:hypothetical protein